MRPNPHEIEAFARGLQRLGFAAEEMGHSLRRIRDASARVASALERRTRRDRGKLQGDAAQRVAALIARITNLPR